MNEILKCRFLTTVQNQSQEGIAPAELQAQLAEFIGKAKELLFGSSYFDVSDTLDSLAGALQKVTTREKKTLCSSLRSARTSSVAFIGGNGASPVSAAAASSVIPWIRISAPSGTALPN